MVLIRDDKHKRLTRHAVTTVAVRPSQPAGTTRILAVVMLVAAGKETAP